MNGRFLTAVTLYFPESELRSYEEAANSCGIVHELTAPVLGQSRIVELVYANKQFPFSELDWPLGTERMLVWNLSSGEQFWIVHFVSSQDYENLSSTAVAYRLMNQTKLDSRDALDSTVSRARTMITGVHQNKFIALDAAVHK